MNLKTGVAFWLSCVALFPCDTMCEACDSQEYAHGEICCPKCNRGERVAKNCTDTTSTLCKTCPESTYMDHPNELNECKRCQKCEEEGMITKLRCSPTSNSVCECGEGFFCSVPADRGCSKCLNHTVCSEGQFTKQNGTLENDTKCEHCSTITNSLAEACGHNEDCLRKCGNSGPTFCVIEGLVLALAGMATFTSRIL
ncbi:tumor necrosis factor receptor superfamily member 14-like [Lepisosteus oculatus]|uniref:tumor necrosis factor receptor superfamily member 14-like n=1 Tax=Lepisosteus oculatus TaxID=7918 RepID=UPI0007405403|nr:PREDICTED: tumor necrosis factor receptor superfamily member 14-like [Lepisosteus oculatus]WFD54360.1 tumor necrosis factor receptor superfamily member 14 [Lepisosteus oculatus]